MLNTDAFLTALYVMVDDFCKEHLPVERHPGPRGGLDRSEIITLAIFSEWGRFRSENDFYRFADEQLRGAFPQLPSRSRYNRLVRRHDAAVAGFGLHMSDLMQAEHSAVQSIDCTAVPVRDYRRRGNSWLLGDVSIGKSSRIGWFEGFRLLIAVDSVGVISGYERSPPGRGTLCAATRTIVACGDDRPCLRGHVSRRQGLCRQTLAAEMATGVRRAPAGTGPARGVVAVAA
jgi:hypothetical protein